MESLSLQLKLIIISVFGIIVGIAILIALVRTKAKADKTMIKWESELFPTSTPRDKPMSKKDISHYMKNRDGF